MENNLSVEERTFITLDNKNADVKCDCMDSGIKKILSNLIEKEVISFEKIIKEGPTKASKPIFEEYLNDLQYIQKKLKGITNCK